MRLITRYPYLSILLIVYSLSSIALFQLSDESLLRYIPDDGFIALSQARGFAEFGFPTMDGVAKTSGFHPLWISIVTVFQYFGLNFRFVCALGIALYALSVYLLVVIAKKFNNFNSANLWILGLVLFLTPWQFLKSFNCLETSLLLLSSGSLINLYLRNGFSKPYLLGIFLAMTVLSRTDAAFLAASLVMFHVLRHKEKAQFLLVLKSLVCAFLVLLPWFTYSYFALGSIVQNTATTILNFETRYLQFHNLTDLLNGRRFDEFGVITLRYLSKDVFPFFFVFYCSAIVCFVYLKNKVTLLVQVVLATSFAYIGLLILAGSYRMTWREWYSAPVFYFAVIVLFLLTPALCSIKVYLSRNVVLVAFCTFLTISSLPQWHLFRDGLYSPQSKALENIRKLEEKMDSQQRYVGYSDSGIASFFGSFNVVNLDGASNNEVSQYIKDGKLFNYIESRNLRYFVLGREWWNRSWLMGEDTSFRYISLGDGLRMRLVTNDEMVANFHSTDKRVWDNLTADFASVFGSGWHYPIADFGNPSFDGAWKNASYYMNPISEGFKQSGVWAIDQNASLILPLQSARQHEITIYFRLGPGQETDMKIEVGGVTTPIYPARAKGIYKLSFQVVGSDSLGTVVPLRFPNPKSPYSLGINDDKRLLSISVLKIISRRN
jgi:hypothetical protein